MKKNFKFGKAITLMVFVSALQVLGILGSAVYLFEDGVSISSPGIFILPALLVISVAALLVFLSLRRSMLLMNERISQAESSVAALEELNNTLRAQRHDFMNHLQVVYSLIDLNSFDDAAAYIEKVYGDIQKVSGVLKTSIPAVNAILQAKQLMCESRGITVTFDIRTTLSELPMQDWEFCRVLGNIIDNSIHALTESDMGREKRLAISLYEELRGYCFRIANNGPPIPPGIWRSIFEAGFTTRQSGEGMGLTICHRLLASCGGSLRVLSNKEETVFEGYMPRSAKAS